MATDRLHSDRRAAPTRVFPRRLPCLRGRGAATCCRHGFLLVRFLKLELECVFGRTLPEWEALLLGQWVLFPGQALAVMKARQWADRLGRRADPGRGRLSGGHPRGDPALRPGLAG